MQQKKKWAELTPKQQTVILVVASTEIALTATTLIDLARRPSEQVRGRKAIWALGMFIQPIGPISYLIFGIRRPSAVAENP